VVDVGVSVKGRTINEDDVTDDWETHIADWPNFVPPEKV
jgi:hypothetical protein